MLGKRIWLFAWVVACGSSRGRDPLEPPDLRALPRVEALGAERSSAARAGESRLRERDAGSLPLAATPASSELSVEAAAPDASWTVVCEAREDTDRNGVLGATPGARGAPEGDRLARYLELPTGESLAIDALVASSPSGRFLLVRRAGRLDLIDTTTSSARALAGIESSFEWSLPARRRVVLLDAVAYYLRNDAGRSELVELVLPNGPERTLYSGGEELVGLEVEPSGAHVVLELASSGGRRRASRASDGDVEPPCGATAPLIRARRAKHDHGGFLVVPREGGSPQRMDDLALVFGKGFIRRRADQSLLLERDGRARVLGNADCRGRILFADPERDLILLGCALPKKPSRLGVELLSHGTRRALGIDVAELAVDEPARAGVRLFPLYPGADTVLFDAERQNLRRFEPGDLVLAVWAERAMIRRGRTALLYDANSDRLSELPAKLEPLHEAVQTGPMVHASPLVVDLAAGRCIGNVSGRSLAVSLSGEVLLAAVPASAETLARGPLLWQAPESIP